MASPHLRKNHLSKGSAYAGPKHASPDAPESHLAGTVLTADGPEPVHRNRPPHLRVSPEELGFIGAELAKRLNFAAEEFLTELVAEQVRTSFREELGLFEDDEEV